MSSFSRLLVLISQRNESNLVLSGQQETTHKQQYFLEVNPIVFAICLLITQKL